MSLAEAQELTGAKNVRLAVSDKELRIYCDLSQSCGPSSSGKSVVIASSSGNRPLGQSNAFIGLNLFTKSLEKRDVTEKGVASLRSDTFSEVTDAFAWRVEDDGKTLCMRITFDAIKERPASSGKSVLLASSGGNKAVGDTGIMCGLNVYRPVTATFNVAAIAEKSDAERTVTVGESVTLEGGFTVHYASPTVATITLRTTEATLKSTKAICLPKDVRLANETTLAMHVGSVAVKRARSPATDASADADGGKNGKSHNCTVACQKEETTEDDALVVSVTFDPTKTSGRTGSAKSFAVGSSAGFQALYDAARRPLCRVSFNAYRPAPPVTDDVVAMCVKDILERRPDGAVETMTLSQLMGEVMENLQLQEGHKDLIKKPVHDAALREMSRIRSQGSQSSTD